MPLHARVMAMRAFDEFASDLAPGDTVRIRDQRWRVLSGHSHGTSPRLTTLEVQGDDAGNRGHRARFLLPFEPCERLPPEVRPAVVGARRWRHVARRALADAAPSWASLRSAARADLRLLPFQLEPAMAYVRGLGCRLLIADAVGLGKTVQAGLVIAEMFHRTPDGRALVVAPAGLRDQWQGELDARFGLRPQVLDAGSVARAGSELSSGANPWGAFPLVVTSIDYIKRPEVIRACESLAWDVMVFDEAHDLCGRSDRASAASALAARARAVVILTATPHSGDDEAFERLRRLGDIDGRCPLLLFRRTRDELAASLPGRVSRRRSTLMRVRPTPAEARMHAGLLGYAEQVWRGFPSQSRGADASRLAVSVLLRRACSSPASLARSLERRISLLADVPLAAAAHQLLLPLAADGGDESPALELAAPGMADRNGEVAWLRSLLVLATSAIEDESKLGALRRLLARTAEPAIVFTQYRDTLARISQAVAADACVHLHGGLTPWERREAVRAFTTGKARLLLATDAASQGLNLHHRCRLVISLELPWTPLRLEQRVGRVDRLGQARTVHAIQLVAGGTSEESVVARLTGRAERAEAAVADAIVTGIDAATDAAGPPAISGALEARPVTSLRRDAEEEAARLTLVRALGAGPHEVGPSRPVVALLRSRVRGVARAATRRAPGRLWAFRLLICRRRGRLGLGHAGRGRRLGRAAPGTIRAGTACPPLAAADVARAPGGCACGARRAARPRTRRVRRPDGCARKGNRLGAAPPSGQAREPGRPGRPLRSPPRAGRRDRVAPPRRPPVRLRPRVRRCADVKW